MAKVDRIEVNLKNVLASKSDMQYNKVFSNSFTHHFCKNYLKKYFLQKFLLTQNPYPATITHVVSFVICQNG